jgi:DNA-directed RNA polymerase specialized sigma24 family protein
MGDYDNTSMGGQRETFLTTHWSLIEDVKKHQDKDQSFIGILLKRYWKPVYCYLRGKGYDNEQAKDLTQGFFHEVVLNRDLVMQADQCKGRFRTFLLYSLNQYLIDQIRRETAKKRIPKERIVSLDIAGPPELPQTITNLSPEDCFNYAWKSALLDQTLSEVESAYAEQGMETHWYVFNERIVQPNLQGTKPLSIKNICAKYGIEDELKVSSMITTVKRRFRTALKKNLRNTVTSETLINEELREIVDFFSKNMQDSKNLTDK